MSHEVILHSCAEEDVLDAMNWYEKKLHGLGNRFLFSLDATLQIISRNPNAFPKVYKDYRRALLRRFPYGVFYIIENEKVIVMAVFHEKRNHLSIKNR
jgi:plasmid stabilization system protein ParE